MKVRVHQKGFSIYLNGRLLINHHRDKPCAYLGQGQVAGSFSLGNFDSQDEITMRVPLGSYHLQPTDNGYSIDLYHINDRVLLHMEIREVNGRVILTTRTTGDFNRCWLRLSAEADEFIYGGGEQFSYFNLRGKRFPIITSEQGVGRNKKTLITFLADSHDGSGGDYWTTFFPQPTFISSKKYYCHIANNDYQVLDFSHDDFHELYLWGTDYRITFESEETYVDLLFKLTGLLGRQPVLPAWAYTGSWLGIQGGQQVCIDKTERMLAAGTVVSAVWAQDWSGIRQTSFGKRLKWDWHWDTRLYPNMPDQIVKWKQDGIRFLGYINPYLCTDGRQFADASTAGYLVRNAFGEDYLVDFGEFDCGIVDLTNPTACNWYRNIIITNLIDSGMKGWMADFGEYLPLDAVLFSGEDPIVMHNRWPGLWAKVCYDALEQSGQLGKSVFFMRAGSADSHRYCPMIWAGDQNVDWSLDDGLASVIVAALSLGMSGYGIHTSDIGGYTTLFDMKRTKELFQRWTDFAIFSVTMRTHEGNRPGSNWQFDSDDETIAHFAWSTQVHARLEPYIRDLLLENTEKGLPLIRPLFIHYEQDPRAYEMNYQYLFGQDLICAPVYNQGQVSQDVYLPSDGWIYLWDGQSYGQGKVKVDSPIGKPPVFYRRDSKYIDIFASVCQLGPWQSAQEFNQRQGDR